MDISSTDVVAWIALVVAIFSAVIALITYTTQQKSISADFMLRFDKAIVSGRNAEVLNAIDFEKEVLTEGGGPFSLEDLTNLLDQFELLAVVYRNGVISKDMIYDAFSYYLEKVNQNKEVRKFIDVGREEDPELYLRFEELAKEFTERHEKEVKRLGKKGAENRPPRTQSSEAHLKP